MKMNHVDWRGRTKETQTKPPGRRLVSGLQEASRTESFCLVQDIELFRSSRHIEHSDVEGFEIRFRFRRPEGAHTNAVESTESLFVRKSDMERLCEAIKEV